VTLGLSGGLDSVVLLHALVALRGRHPFLLNAVHVHHGLSPHAEAWADFCTRVCAANGVELAIHRVRIPPNDAAGPEATARRERQAVFAGLDTDFLVTAHQQDDQAETVLLQLLRGAGPKGLAAMGERQTRAGWGAVHLRPLLNCPRGEVLGYAQAHGIEWVDDESNLDTRYRRNALRHDVMPLLATHFPGSRATLARAASLQAEAAQLLDELAWIDAAAGIADERLDCSVLAALSPLRARNLLRHFVERQGLVMPNARRLGEALHQLLDARADARVRVVIGGRELWRFRGGAYLVPPAPKPVAPVRWRGEPLLAVPAAGVSVRMETLQGGGIKRDVLAAGEVTLGVRRGGERLRLHPGGPHRSLKKLLQEYDVPPWQRDRLPLLWCDGRLVWAAGIGIDADVQAGRGESGLLPVVDA
jgi:tRNA(Ile)-lysidine synthase